MSLAVVREGRCAPNSDDHDGRGEYLVVCLLKLIQLCSKIASVKELRMYPMMKLIRATFFAIRFLVKGIAFICTPISLVLFFFAFGISWILFQICRLTQPPSGDTMAFDEATAAESGWREWGSCMLEASFDTISALVPLAVMGRFILNAENQEQILRPLYDPVFFWFLFWTLNLIPFVIRLRAKRDLEMNQY